MDAPYPAGWPRTEAEAVAIQDQLRHRVSTTGSAAGVRRAAGLDVAYATDSSRSAAAVVVLDIDGVEVVEEQTSTGESAFPYVPGLLAFRELPGLLDALARVRATPDVLICDGYGVAHPRRFGLASHIGVLTGLPSIGVAKTPFVGRYRNPAPERGAYSDLLDGDEVIGRVLRTRSGVKPVFVSVGHAIDLADACDLVLRLSPAYRLPQPIRAADRLSREALAAGRR